MLFLLTNGAIYMKQSEIVHNVLFYLGNDSEDVLLPPRLKDTNWRGVCT